MQPSPTCTGNPFRTRSFQDIVFIGSEAHAAYIRINAVTSGFVKLVLLGRWSLTWWGGGCGRWHTDSFPSCINSRSRHWPSVFLLLCLYLQLFCLFLSSPVLFLLSPQPSFSFTTVSASSSPLFLSSSFLAPQSVPVFFFSFSSSIVSYEALVRSLARGNDLGVILEGVVTGGLVKIFDTTVCERGVDDNKVGVGETLCVPVLWDFTKKRFHHPWLILSFLRTPFSVATASAICITSFRVLP